MSKDRFVNQLERQLHFLLRSCEAYDRGDKEEAVRIALIARVLIHETSHSTSILTHLGRRDIRLLSTTPPKEVAPESIIYEGGLTRLTKNGWVAKLDRSSTEISLPLDQWWEQVIHVNEGDQFSRRLMILLSSNKDGAAHVDADLEELSKLVVGPWTICSPDGEELRASNHHFAYLRQIGYELLHSEELLSLTGSDFQIPNLQERRKVRKNARVSSLSQARRLHKMAKALIDEGDVNEAREILADVEEDLKDADSEREVELLSEVVLGLAGTYRKSEEQKQKMRVFNRLLGYLDGASFEHGKIPKYHFEAVLGKAVALHAQGRTEEADEWYERAVEFLRSLITLWEVPLPAPRLNEAVDGMRVYNYRMKLYFDSLDWAKVVEISDEFIRLVEGCTGQELAPTLIEKVHEEGDDEQIVQFEAKLAKGLWYRAAAYTNMRDFDEGQKGLETFRELLDHSTDQRVVERLESLIEHYS